MYYVHISTDYIMLGYNNFFHLPKYIYLLLNSISKKESMGD